MILFEDFEAKVVKITDGDTLTVNVGVHLFVIRIAHIDAPEDGQPGAREARAALSRLCYGKMVRVKPKCHDRYSRVVAELETMEGEDVSEYMLSNGHSWYFDPKKANERYAEYEREARSKKVGIWARHDCQCPSIWRKQKGVTRRR